MILSRISWVSLSLLIVHVYASEQEIGRVIRDGDGFVRYEKYISQGYRLGVRQGFSEDKFHHREVVPGEYYAYDIDSRNLDRSRGSKTTCLSQEQAKERFQQFEKEYRKQNSKDIEDRAIKVIGTGCILGLIFIWIQIVGTSNFLMGLARC